MARPRRVRYEQSALTGVRDSQDPSLSLPDKCLSLINVYPLDPEIGGGVISRPGFTQIGGQIGGGLQVQGIFQYSKRDGTESTCAVAGNSLYTYNWGTDIWTNKGSVVSTTDQPAFAVNFNDKLIITSTVANPATWDGTTVGSLGGSAGSVFGPPAVYYAKLFFIKYGARSTIIWSEENDETTGYTAGGFNNSWILGQTDQEALFCLIGMNDALYYFRERSLGAITGAVSSSFSSTGTREGVSETIGTRSPGSVIVHGRTLYFVDADGLPQACIAGAGMVDPGPWKDARKTLADVQRSELQTWAVAANYIPAELILLGIPFAADTVTASKGVARLLTFSNRTRAFAGQWATFRASALGVVKDDTLAPALLHGSGNGYVYRHGNPGGAVWTDANNASDGGTLSISHTITGPAWGYDVQSPKRFDQVDVSLVTLTNLSGATLQLDTPTEFGSPQTVAGLATIYALWDVFQWDVGQWSSESGERHAVVGVNALGRWGRATLQHNNGSERLWLTNWATSAFLEPDEELR